MTLTNVFLTIGFEHITGQFVVLLHAGEFKDPYIIHAAESLADAAWYCGAAFPFLKIEVDSVEVAS